MLAMFYIVMLFIIVPTLKIKGTHYNYGIYYYPKEIWMVGVTCIIIVYLIWKYLKMELKLDKLYIGIFALLFLLLIAGSIYTQNIFYAKRVIIGVAIYITTFIYFYNYSKKKAIIYILWGTAVLQGIIGITQKLGIYYKVTKIWDMGNRLTLGGTIGNVNMYSHFMSAVFLVSTYYIFIERKKSIKYIMFLGNMFIFYMILETQTRSSMLSIIVGIIILIFIKRKTLIKNIMLITLLSGILFTSLIYWGISHNNYNVKERFAVNNGINSTNYRIFIWREAVELIKEKPLTGYGTGSFITKERDVFKKLTAEKKYEKFKKVEVIAGRAHNEYLQIFAENGFVGFVIAITIVMLTLYKVIKSKKYSSWIFFAGILSYMITSCFEFPLHMIHNGTIAFALLGMFAEKSKKNYEINMLKSKGLFFNFFDKRTTNGLRVPYKDKE